MNEFSEQLNDAKAAKQGAMEQVEAHANPEWQALILELTRIVCLTHRLFTIDDVMALYVAIQDDDRPVTHELRALGPAMLRAARAGYCKKTNRVAGSHRRSNHNRPLAVWQSLICEVPT
ncbi:hypothetical protein [Bradyrhizobium elkanii]|uniref:hypothetical protein n=1 Tax=Bradyrhizobium elkanii TaxID=29448 RepID=UPI0004AFF9F0|nr:hypothetical protein [Bradyrhizobium elkanii]WLA79607.1 hypothetical protein QNJ99_29950 [Bradyrhizobium elkanii]